MKRITALIPDDVDVSSIVNQALEFKLEVVDEGKNNKKALHRSKTTTTRQVVMDHYSPSATFRMSNVEQWLIKEGFAASSASPILSRLIEEKYIRNLGNRTYQYVKPLEKPTISEVKTEKAEKADKAA